MSLTSKITLNLVNIMAEVTAHILSLKLMKEIKWAMKKDSRKRNDEAFQLN